ncbi:MAG TPA: cytochrome P450, partial [Acidimicrobiales bacterium]|nr:cytochrome P450 [Acidimicrobiales bacterium]
LLRWTTPVISFLRTATRPVVVRGQDVAEGDHVMLLYAAANRDTEVFGPDADQLRVDRHPNPHVSFGFGPHFCLGAALARLEARTVLDELLDRFPEWDVDLSTASLSPTSTVRGWQTLPVVVP